MTRSTHGLARNKLRTAEYDVGKLRSRQCLARFAVCCWLVLVSAACTSAEHPETPANESDRFGDLAVDGADTLSITRVVTSPQTPETGQAEAGPDSAIADPAEGVPRESAEQSLYETQTPQIIENHSPVWQSAAWRIVHEPTLRIGALDGAAPYLFRSLLRATRFPDGKIAVVDRGTSEVRVVGPDGQFLQQFGRRGQGPGEFGGDPVIVVVPPDTIIAWDQRNARLTWFRVGSGLIREQSMLQTLEQMGMSPMMEASWTLTADGDLFSNDGRRNWPSPNLTRMQQDTFRPVIVTRAGIATFGELALWRRTSVDGRNISEPFGPTGRATARQGELPVIIADTRTWQLSFFGADGRLYRVVRANIPRIPVTSSMLEAEYQRQAGMTGVSYEAVRGFAEGVGVPDSLPAIAAIHATPDGHVVAGRRPASGQQPGYYDVIDATGRWLGTVEFPPNIGTVLHWDDEYVLTRYTGALGVEYLHQYRVERSDR
jgi:hypothetical protein